MCECISETTKCRNSNSTVLIVIKRDFVSSDTGNVGFSETAVAPVL
jgi:hypothetical protein